MKNTNGAQDGRILRGKKRREDVLVKAVEVFGEHGFHAASLRTLAEKVGLSEAGLIHHFGSKAGLLQAVLEERDRQDAVQRQHEEENGVGFADTMRAQVQRNSHSPGLVGLHVQVSAEATNPEHPAHEAITSRYDKVASQDLEKFAVQISSGVVPKNIDPANLGRITTAVMDGLQLQWLLDPSVNMVAAFEDYLRLIGLGEQANTDEQ